MHLIVESHLKTFLDHYPSKNNESKNFEAFVNYCLFRNFSADNIDPFSLIYDGDDPGIDGMMIFVDDSYIASDEELIDVFESRSSDADVAIVFVQSTTSDRWDKSKVNTFAAGVTDILSNDPQFPLATEIQEQRQIFFDLFKHIGKIKNGKPTVHCHYAVTGKLPVPREVGAAFSVLENHLISMDYFNSVNVEPIDRDSLINLWSATQGTTEAQIETIGIAPFPKVGGIEASYVATVSAKSFVDNVLSDSAGKLRQRIFDENVRDYIGDDAEVNQEITQTILDTEKQKRFGIMNNGVTIVSPDVRVQGIEIFLRDFQVVNGCQTSNVLYANRANIGNDANLMMKIIHAKDAQYIEDVVRSTNRQSKVQDEQFLATLDCVKNIEKYFDARGEEEEHRLFFERRRNQYGGQKIPAMRIFDIKQLARCVGAMFLDKPELATRYPNRLTGELKQNVFDPEYKEEIYYTAAWAHYRIVLNFSNARVDPKYSSLKWHLMLGVKEYLDDGSAANLKHRKVEALCDSIRQLLASTEAEHLAVLSNICQIIWGPDGVTRDQLKAQGLAARIKEEVQKMKG